MALEEAWKTRGIFFSYFVWPPCHCMPVVRYQYRYVRETSAYQTDVRACADVS